MICILTCKCRAIEELEEKLKDTDMTQGLSDLKEKVRWAVQRNLDDLKQRRIVQVDLVMIKESREVGRMCKGFQY